MVQPYNGKEHVIKPQRIVLIRHGQSEGNVNKLIYSEKPDYTLHLTETGRQQAHNAGKLLSELIPSHEDIKFYVSPFWRTRETLLEIKKWFTWTQVRSPVYEDPRLREQEWGSRMNQPYSKEHETERDAYGHFYWRFPGGESNCDVFDRISDFLQTLHRDFEKSTFPSNVIIVTHGMAMRVFLMRWLHLTVEEFEKLKNPKNCGMYILERGLDDKYTLTSDLPTHELKHNFQFPKYETLPVSDHTYEV